MYTPDDCLMLSGLQHFRFCRRQQKTIKVAPRKGRVD